MPLPIIAWIKASESIAVNMKLTMLRHIVNIKSILMSLRTGEEESALEKGNATIWNCILRLIIIMELVKTKILILLIIIIILKTVTQTINNQRKQKPIYPKSIELISTA